jgi:hypothetical protein
MQRGNGPLQSTSVLSPQNRHLGDGAVAQAAREAQAAIRKASPWLQA